MINTIEYVIKNTTLQSGGLPKLTGAEEEFLINVITQYHLSNSSRNDGFLVMDINQKIIGASNTMIMYLGYADFVAIKNKTFSEIYQFPESYMAITHGMNQICQNTIENGYATEALCVGHFVNEMQAFFLDQIPIHFLAGNIIGTVTKFKAINKWRPQSPQSLDNFSFRQTEIIFLLSLGASQKEIASVYKVTRGTIARSIDAICRKLKISGSSEKLLNEQMVNYSISRFPVTLFKPFISPISFLFTNRHILEYLN